MNRLTVNQRNQIRLNGAGIEQLADILKDRNASVLDFVNDILDEVTLSGIIHKVDDLADTEMDLNRNERI